MQSRFDHEPNSRQADLADPVGVLGVGPFPAAPESLRRRVLRSVEALGLPEPIVAPVVSRRRLMGVPAGRCRSHVDARGTPR